MIAITHNFDTGYKTIAKTISTELRKYPNLYKLAKLDIKNRDIVTMVRESLEQDTDNLMRHLQSVDPKILFAVSPQIETLKHGILDNLPKGATIQDKSDKTKNKTLTGISFKYKVRCQLIVFSRSEYAIRELSLWLIYILHELKGINYCLRLFDTTDDTLLMTVDDYAYIKFTDIADSTFSQRDDMESGILASALEFYLLDEFFYLTDEIKAGQSSEKLNQTVKKLETKLKNTLCKKK
jgi:hypothetical protein